MIQNGFDEKITPKQAAQNMISAMLTNMINDEDIPERFPEVTEREQCLIAEQYWKLFNRIQKKYLGKEI